MNDKNIHLSINKKMKKMKLTEKQKPLKYGHRGFCGLNTKTENLQICWRQKKN